MTSSLSIIKKDPKGRDEASVKLDVKPEIMQIVESLAMATNTSEEFVLTSWIESYAESLTRIFPDKVAKEIERYLKIDRDEPAEDDSLGTSNSDKLKDLQ